MTFRIDKECILWKLDNEFTLLYFWWGLEPWGDMNPGGAKRVYEVGFGYWSKQIFK